MVLQQIIFELLRTAHHNGKSKLNHRTYIELVRSVLEYLPLTTLLSPTAEQTGQHYQMEQRQGLPTTQLTTHQTQSTLITGLVV